MNYGQLRSIFVDEYPPAPEEVPVVDTEVDLSKEASGIAFSLCLEAWMSYVYADSYCKDEERVSPVTQERFERFLELLPKKATFCRCC